MFDPRSSFKHVDKDCNGVVTVNDLRTFLADNGFFATEKEISLIMNKFDKY